MVDKVLGMATKKKRPAHREVLPLGLERRGGVIVPVAREVPPPGKSPRSSSALLQVQQWKSERDLAQSGLEQAIAVARRAGASWADVADALGVSVQAAHRRYRQVSDVG